jgi:hypothetical protein
MQVWMLHEGRTVRLRIRLTRLEQRAPPRRRVILVILDLPDGSPPVMFDGRDWLPCPDVAAVLANGEAIKIYKGFDPRTAL